VRSYPLTCIGVTVKGRAHPYREATQGGKVAKKKKKKKRKQM
jgi:hypothetical protein